MSVSWTRAMTVAAVAPGYAALFRILPGQAGFTWLTWWLGDAAGVLLVGAPILAWPLRGPRRSWTEALAPALARPSSSP